ncbi:MAG: hypothetical protein CL607_18630 [Anaerolineaceae bacterium]|nr:hypothetical protein [Anaerolineaceae bacterium]
MNPDEFIAPQILTLNGTWAFVLDPENAGASNDRYDTIPNSTIEVPGSWAEHSYGNPPKMRYLWGWNAKYEYEGIAWYIRDVDIPADWSGQRVALQLKGVRWRSQVWIDKTLMGEQDSLSVSHVYDVTSAIQAGKTQRITIQIDNRMLYPLEESHINSLQTGTHWGGITGGIELIARSETSIADLKCQPDIHNKRLNIFVRLTQHAKNLTLRIRVNDPESGATFENHGDIASESVSLAVELGEQARLWSDDDPHLYRVECILEQNGDIIDVVETRTGIREIAVEGKNILLNGKAVFLRGYVDCCIFPQTGYPSWDIEHYRRQFSIAKSYGFNHVRLHGWTAPEPFWNAADEIGMLVQTELPHWSKHYIQSDVPPPEDVHQYLLQELELIVDALNVHPSWVMFSNGNELVQAEGHQSLLDLVEHGRSLDPSRIYTDQTGFGRMPAINRDVDYLIQSCNWHPPKKIYDAASNDTTQDFAAITAMSDRPLLGHEHGQFTMYVRPSEAEKYNGPIEPTWLESIKDSFEAKGISNRVDNYIKASGIHIVRTYKENIERARRTPGLSGIQLLDIRDFPGQGHATTGILDMFWDSKGLVQPEVFAQFNSAVVLLMRLPSPTFYNGDTVRIQIDVSNFSGHSLTGTLEWDLQCEAHHIQGKIDVDDVSNGTVTTIAHLVIPTEPDREAYQWSLVVRLNETENKWDLWSFPRLQKLQHRSLIRSRIENLSHMMPDVDYHDDFGSHMLTWDTSQPRLNASCELAISDRLSLRLLQYLHDGGSVWLMPDQKMLFDAVLTRYLPPFWSYLHFPDNVSTVMGMIIHDHATLCQFPHDGFSNWQWYDLVNQTPAICLDSVPEIQPIVEVVDNFNRAKKLAYAFETKVGQGRLFVSTWRLYDLNVVGRPEATYLLSQIMAYLTSEAFVPATKLSVAQVLGLFKLTNSESTLLE